MSGIIGSAGSKSGIVGEAGLGVPNVSMFTLSTNDTVVDGKLTNWNDPSTPLTSGGSVGKLVTESSGDFTLPLGGVWLIQGIFNVYHVAGDNWFGVQLWETGGAMILDGYGGTNGLNCTQINSISLSHLVKSAGVSYYFKTVSVNGGSYVIGYSGWTVNAHNSTVNFIKLGNNSTT